MYHYKVLLVKAIDGDTIDINLDLGFKIFTNQRMNLDFINAPETTSTNLIERTYASEAKTFVLDWFSKNKTVYVKTSNSDTYGNINAEFFNEKNESLNQTMIDEGYAWAANSIESKTKNFLSLETKRKPIPPAPAPIPPAPAPAPIPEPIPPAPAPAPIPEPIPPAPAPIPEPIPPAPAPIPEPIPPAPAPIPEPIPPAPVPTPTNKYRFQQHLLFQRAHKKFENATFVNRSGNTISIPGNDYWFDSYHPGAQAGLMGCGTTPTHLCILSSWAWTNIGGDWVDAEKVRQGKKPWAISPIIPTLSPAGSITFDVSEMIKFAKTIDNWYSILISQKSTGTINFSGVMNETGAPKHQLTIEYTDGTFSSCELWYTCAISSSTTKLTTHNDFIDVTPYQPLVMEFIRPEIVKEISKATLTMHYTKTSLGSTSLNVLLISPQKPSLNQDLGIAHEYYQDAGIFSNPDVASSLRITDEMKIDSILDVKYVGSYSKSWNGIPMTTWYVESLFDPTLWGTPGKDHLINVKTPTQQELDELFPKRVITDTCTKLVGQAYKSQKYGDTLSLVTSSQLRDRGLPALADGLGALDFVYHGCRVPSGQASYSSLTTGGPNVENLSANDMFMFFKREHIGQLTDGYMRMHVMLGEGWEARDELQWNYLDLANFGKYPDEIGRAPESLTWRCTDFSGKFPGGFQQTTSNRIPIKTYVHPTRLDSTGQNDTTATIGYAGGGYSSSSGIYGYQGRWMFTQGFYKMNHRGPAIGGASIGIELYDFAQNPSSIPSQAFIGYWDSSKINSSNKKGMGFFYEKKWYCIEMRWKMNDITIPYEEPPIGKHYLESGFIPNGFIEWWIDGVSAGQTPLFAHRSSRMIDWLLQISNGSPFGTKNMMRPMTNVPEELYMGATHAILETYYGGRTPNPSDKHVYINGIVVSNGKYIGPMKGVSRENGGSGD